jgi:hypothetical protein
MSDIEDVLSEHEKTEIKAGLAKLLETKGMLITEDGRALVLKHISHISPLVLDGFMTKRYHLKLVCYGLEETLIFGPYHTGITIPEKYIFQPRDYGFAAQTLREMLLEAVGQIA